MGQIQNETDYETQFAEMQRQITRGDMLIRPPSTRAIEQHVANGGERPNEWLGLSGDASDPKNWSRGTVGDVRFLGI